MSGRGGPNRSSPRGVIAQLSSLGRLKSQRCAEDVSSPDEEQTFGPRIKDVACPVFRVTPGNAHMMAAYEEAAMG